MKTGILLSTLLTIGTSLSSQFYEVKSPSFSQYTSSSKNMLLANDKETDKQIIDIDKLVQDALYASAPAIDKSFVRGKIVSMKYNYLNVTDIKVTPLEQPDIIQNPTALYMGSNILTNDLDYAQTIGTPSYTQEVSNIVTSTTTIGWSISAGLKYKFISGSVDINYNSSKTNVTSDNFTVTSPSQKINVPPHTKYKVTVYLGQNHAKVNLDLHARLSGSVNCIFFQDPQNRYTFTIDIATALRFLDKLPKGITIDDKTNEVVFDGVAIAEDISENNTFTVLINPVN